MKRKQQWVLENTVDYTEMMATSQKPETKCRKKHAAPRPFSSTKGPEMASRSHNHLDSVHVLKAQC